jgi:hypothetical protein
MPATPRARTAAETRSAKASTSCRVARAFRPLSASTSRLQRPLLTTSSTASWTASSTDLLRVLRMCVPPNSPHWSASLIKRSAASSTGRSHGHHRGRRRRPTTARSWASKYAAEPIFSDRPRRMHIWAAPRPPRKRSPFPSRCHPRSSPSHGPCPSRADLTCQLKMRKARCAVDQIRRSWLRTHPLAEPLLLETQHDLHPRTAASVLGLDSDSVAAVNSNVRTECRCPESIPGALVPFVE